MTRRATLLASLRGALDGLLLAGVCLLLAGPVVTRILPALGYETIVIVGRSMEPSIPLGSVAVVSRVDAASIRPGEVVSIRVPDRNVTYTHRVVEVVDREGQPWLRTRGDNNDANDPVLVPAAWALGRVDARLPGVGYLVRLVSIPSGVAAVIGLGLTLLLAARLLEDLELSRQRRVPADRTSAAPAIRGQATLAPGATGLTPGATGLTPAASALSTTATALSTTATVLGTTATALSTTAITGTLSAEPENARDMRHRNGQGVPGVRTGRRKRQNPSDRPNQSPDAYPGPNRARSDSTRRSIRAS